ncbi:hypothetical protein BA177_06655 [Woeseia oceani]|uniref:Uncharacterized protein n=2 Tax=Woeseia oceani TaxID=1548547 RepID=A0A193LEJ1_9GAMM|nr:hypothetical protein BA177_06655 [Woeseia oceani]
MLSSAFVTVPVWVYSPLADAGMVFLFDIVVPVVLLWSLYLRGFSIPKRTTAPVALLFLIIPLLFVPLGYVFLDDTFFGYHTVILSNVLFRSFIVVAAVAVLASELRRVEGLPIVRLMAVQFSALFVLGVLQYAGGVDFVVYERLKDVENAVDALMAADEAVFFGFGFLGLFRGAVPQMAVIAIFWCLIVTNLRDRVSANGLLLLTVSLTSLVCVAGSLSRIGLGALAVVLVYSCTINTALRRWALLLVPLGLALLMYSGYWVVLQSLTIDFMADRFSFDELTGASGSGSTRIESAQLFVRDLADRPVMWFTGIGGFNPIATSERYSVFGMHGDYLDVIVRYGVVVGLVYGFVVLSVLTRPLAGFFSRSPFRRSSSRAYGAICCGIPVLALTQGALIFSGAAGYLAAAHAWLAIAFMSATYVSPTDAVTERE